MIQQFHSWLYAQKKWKQGTWTDTRVRSSIIHNKQKVETTEVPIGRWMNKQNMVYPLQWDIIPP